MIFMISTTSGNLEQYESVLSKWDLKERKREVNGKTICRKSIEIHTIEDLVLLKKELSEELIITDSCWFDKQEIEIYDGFRE